MKDTLKQTMSERVESVEYFGATKTQHTRTLLGSTAKPPLQNWTTVDGHRTTTTVEGKKTTDRFQTSMTSGALADLVKSSCPASNKKITVRLVKAITKAILASASPHEEYNTKGDQWEDGFSVKKATLEGAHLVKVAAGCCWYSNSMIKTSQRTSQSSSDIILKADASLRFPMAVRAGVHKCGDQKTCCGLPHQKMFLEVEGAIRGAFAK